MHREIGEAPQVPSLKPSRVRTDKIVLHRTKFEGREVRKIAGRSADERLEEGFLCLIALVFYVVGAFVVLAVVNTPLAADEDFRGINRKALNAIAAVAVVSAFATVYAPWHRLPRDAFFAVPAAGVVLISVCTFFSWGWDSFAYVLYVFPASFFGLYFPSKATTGLAFLLLCGASPLLYDWNLQELVEYAVVYVPVFATVTFVSRYVVREVERKEAARRASEEELVEEKARAMELRRMAEMDGLTGLKNRRSLEARLAEETERSRRLGGRFSLLFMDLDDFKAINDEHGHLVGDEALKLVARVLQEDSRSVDTVARYGGEEFVVLLPGTDSEGARAFYTRGREKLLVLSLKELGLPLRLSAGAVGSEAAPDAGGLMQAADRAMYEAKRGGKDRVFVGGR